MNGNDTITAYGIHAKGNSDNWGITKHICRTMQRMVNGQWYGGQYSFPAVVFLPRAYKTIDDARRAAQNMAKRRGVEFVDAPTLEAA